MESSFLKETVFAEILDTEWEEEARSGCSEVLRLIEEALLRYGVV